MCGSPRAPSVDGQPPLVLDRARLGGLAYVGLEVISRSAFGARINDFTKFERVPRNFSKETMLSILSS